MSRRTFNLVAIGVASCTMSVIAALPAGGLPADGNGSPDGASPTFSISPTAAPVATDGAPIRVHLASDTPCPPFPASSPNPGVLIALDAGHQQTVFTDSTVVAPDGSWSADETITSSEDLPPGDYAFTATCITDVSRPSGDVVANYVAAHFTITEATSTGGTPGSAATPIAGVPSYTG